MSRSSAFSSSLLHLVLLLILSLAVCTISEARPVGVLEKHEEPAAPARKPQISHKDEEKSSVHARVSVSSNSKSSNQTEPEAAGKRDSTQPVKHELKDDRRNHDTTQGESVSWKLPRPKAPAGDERQPGSFNQLDYDPPRTHPPSHN